MQLKITCKTYFCIMFNGVEEGRPKSDDTFSENETIFYIGYFYVFVVTNGNIYNCNSLTSQLRSPLTMFAWFWCTKHMLS